MDVSSAMRVALLASLLALACVGSDPQLTPDQCPVARPPHGSYLGGTCFLACQPGWWDCNGDAMDGCESQNDDVNNCGLCGIRCRDGWRCAMIDDSHACTWR